MPPNTTRPIPPKRRKSVSLTWFFSGMSLELASFIGSVANWILLLSLVFGVVATFFIVGTSDIKEKYWDREREVVRKETARLSADAENARRQIAIANATAAIAKEKAAEANLAIAKIKRLLQLVQVKLYPW